MSRSRHRIVSVAAIARLQIGETTAGRSYDIVLADVAVAPHALWLVRVMSSGRGRATNGTGR